MTFHRFSMKVHEKLWIFMNFQAFLGTLCVDLIHPPKLCAGLVPGGPGEQAQSEGHGPRAGGGGRGAREGAGRAGLRGRLVPVEVRAEAPERSSWKFDR